MAYKTPRGLGRGVSAILGSESTERTPIGYINKEVVGSQTSVNNADIMRIPVGLIQPNPFQPRINFDEEALAELSESIKTLGLIQPITVRKVADGKYQIISGERRFRACKAAGMDMIPAYIRETDDQGMLEMAIVENIQRENLDPIETAMSYQRLIDECNLTQEQMALRIGKKRVSITNYLRLLKLPSKVQHDLKQGLISVGHAKVILSVEDPSVQEQLCDLVIRQDLSVRQLEEKVKTLSRQPKPQVEEEEADMPEEYYKVIEKMGQIFGDNISLKRNAAGKGSITLRFSSDEEIKKLLTLLER